MLFQPTRSSTEDLEVSAHAPRVPPRTPPSKEAKRRTVGHAHLQDWSATGFHRLSDDAANHAQGIVHALDHLAGWNSRPVPPSQKNGPWILRTRAKTTQLHATPGVAHRIHGRCLDDVWKKKLLYSSKDAIRWRPSPVGWRPSLPGTRSY